MFRIPGKSLAASLLSVSLALGAIGASAAPARAETTNNNEVVAILGGLLALYAIGRAIEAQDNRQPPPQHAPAPQVRVAPEQCFIRGNNTHNGRPFRGFLRRCTVNNVAQPRLLPDRCLRLVHTARGPRNIYGGHCMRNEGWVRG